MTKDGWIDFLSGHILGKYSQQFPLAQKIYPDCLKTGEVSSIPMGARNEKYN